MDEAEKKMVEANEKKAKLAEQAANRKAAGITYGFGDGKYGTVPDSWPERFGGRGGYEKMIAEREKRLRDSDADDSPEKQNAEEEERPKKRRRKFKKTRAHIINDISSGSEVEIDIRKGFPSLIGGAPTAGPAEDIAPRAPSLGTPFDPHVNPEYFNQSRKLPEQIKEMLFRMAPLPPEYLEVPAKKKEADL